MDFISKKTLRRAAFAVMSEHFVNALRTSITIIIPVIVFYRLGNSTAALQIGLGTLLVALTDVPGDIYDKARSLSVSTLILALVSLVTLSVLSHPVLLGVVITIFCFGFPLLFIFGGSASAIGSMALIMMIFTYGLKPSNEFFFCCYFIVGGLWYNLSSVLYLRFFPYRPIRHAIGECVTEIAGFLRAKASFYQPKQALTDSYKAVISSHIRVSQKQDVVRAILLRERIIVIRENIQVRQLVRIATEVIDLYEQILAIHFDYSYIHDTLNNLQMLQPVSRAVEEIADELEELSFAISAGIRPQQKESDGLALLITQLENAAVTANGLRSKVIGRIVDNFNAIHYQIKLIYSLLDEPAENITTISGYDAVRFVNNQSFNLKQLRQHFTFSSPVFRFGLRLSFTCLAAYLVTLFVLPGKYSYWLLLTIIIIARPAFSNTHRRNYQRVFGTLIGVPIAIVSFYLISDTSLQITVVALFLLGYFAFLQVNYLISVIFVTLFVIGGLHLLGGDYHELMLQRTYETLLGGAAALIATFLFPFWERKKLNDLIGQVLKANMQYLEYLRSFIMQQPFDIIEYKLIRKQVFVSSADLSRAYEHMLTEPNADQVDCEGLYQFQILNHELYASVASLFLDRQIDPDISHDAHNIEKIDKSITLLSSSLSKVARATTVPASPVSATPLIKAIDCSLRKVMISEQLQIILDLSQNICWQVYKWHS